MQKALPLFLASLGPMRTVGKIPLQLMDVGIAEVFLEIMGGSSLTSKPSRALVWGLAEAMAVRDGQVGKTGGGGNGMGKDRAVR